MAEPLDDEELAMALSIPEANATRAAATMRRLLAERDEARLAYAELRKISIEKLRLEESVRADRAEVRLAELVSEVREWNSDYHGDALLGVILDKYGGADPEP